MELLTQIGPIVVFIIGMFLWVRAIYERADRKREALLGQMEGLTMENVTLKTENAELKRMNSEWHDLANKYHALAVKWYNLSQSMLKGTDNNSITVDQTTVISIPTPDDVFNDKVLPEEILG